MAQAFVDIHRRWLMTPREDLSGHSPREVLLAKLDLIDLDLSSRMLQWSYFLQEPTPLSRDRMLTDTHVLAHTKGNVLRVGSFSHLGSVRFCGSAVHARKNNQSPSFGSFGGLNYNSSIFQRFTMLNIGGFPNFLPISNGI
jgi:hypothetical protein